MEQASASDELYGYFDDFLGLIQHKSSYVRTRGFCLCCALAQWDREHKLEKHMDELLNILVDDKPTVVRQCLPMLGRMLPCKPELKATVENKLSEMDLSKYKDSMSPLIEKDIKALRKAMAAIPADCDAVRLN